MMVMRLVALLLYAMLIAACAPQGAPTVIPTVVLDATALPSATSDGDVRASAIIVPVREASLSFPLTGIVQTVHVELGDRVVEGTPLVTLDPTILDAEVAAAKADVAAAEAQLNYQIRQGQDEVHLQGARADIDRAEALLSAAEATLASATLRAPFDGTVAAISISAGETVVPGHVIIQFGDLAEFEAETTDLAERDVPLVEIGQTAIVLIEALDEEIAGRVAEVAQVSESVGGDVVYRLTIELGRQLPGVRWGMNAEVSVTVDR